MPGHQTCVVNSMSEIALLNPAPNGQRLLAAVCTDERFDEVIEFDGIQGHKLDRCCNQAISLKFRAPSCRPRPRIAYTSGSHSADADLNRAAVPRPACPRRAVYPRRALGASRENRT